MTAPSTSSRPWVVGVAIVVITALLAAAGTLGWLWASGRAAVPGLDDVARAEVTARIQQEVADRVGIEPEDVEVGLGEAPILPQLEQRRLDEVAVTVRVPAERAIPLIAGAIGLDPGALALGDGTLRLQLEVDAILARVQLGIGFAVAAEAGALVFAPSEFVLAGNPVPLAELLGIPVVGDWIRPLTEPREYCVASMLPASLELTDVEAAPAGISLTVEGRDVPIDADALATLGTC